MSFQGYHPGNGHINPFLAWKIIFIKLNDDYIQGTQADDLEL